MLIKIEEKPGEITHPDDVAKVLYSILNTESEIDRDKEHFWVIGLMTRKTIKYIELVSLGTLNASLAYPREIFRLAVSQGIHSMIVGHNHPSNFMIPSEDDNKLTQRLIECGKILDIRVLDHIIIGNDNSSYYAYQRDSNILFF